MVRSSEFLEGYAACDRGISKTHNPYLETAAMFEENPRYENWRSGWEKRFFGEDIGSEP